MPNKLPPYFREYLDERFNAVICEIQEMKELNKTLSVRVTALEAFKWQLISFVTFISVAWALFGNAVNSFLKDIFGHLYKS